MGNPSFEMALKVEGGDPELDEHIMEFLNWLEELKRVRNKLDMTLRQYEEKRARLIEALQK